MTLKLAGCVILDSNGRILLIHRNTPNLEQWEIPGGKIEIGETAEQAAIRELKEELGMNVEMRKYLGKGTFNEQKSKIIYSWFLGVSDSQPVIQERDKFDRANYFSLAEIRDIVTSKGVKCFISQLDNATITL